MLETIKNWIENVADDDEILQVVSAVNSWNGSLESYNFYYMDDLNELFYGVKLTDFLSKLADDFDLRADGFRDTIYGLESCDIEDVIDDIKNNIEEVAETISENIDNICIPDSLQELLDEIEESEE